MTPATLVRKVAEVRHERLAASTRRQYASNLSSVRRFLVALGEPSLTSDLFKKFLVALREVQRGGESPAQILSALRHFQKVDGLWTGEEGQCWADDPVFDEMVAGIRFCGKDAGVRKQTGAITAAMLKELKDFCNLRRQEEMAAAYQIAFSASLRISQVACLRVNSLIENDGDHVLLVSKDKRVQATSRKGEWHYKSIAPDGVAEFRRVAKDRDGKEWLFNPKTWNYEGLLAMIHQASVELGWPQDLEWVFHSARHGGAVEQRLQATLQMSKGTVQKYSKPNVARTGNVKK
jgi:hypothetical protein